jgi:hypothetical protein
MSVQIHDKQVREEHLALARDAGNERPQMEFVKVLSLASSNMSSNIGRNTGSNTKETQTHCHRIDPSKTENPHFAQELTPQKLKTPILRLMPRAGLCIGHGLRL